MQSASRYIITIGVSLGCISILFFFSLLLYIPFWIIVPVISFALISLSKWSSKIYCVRALDKIYNSIWVWIILAGGLMLMVWKSYPLAQRYGGWDAWDIWNLYARYLAAGSNKWQSMMQNIMTHPDYPLLLPGVNGFFIRLFYGYGAVLIPFIICFSITLFIPVIIYLELLRRNIVIAWVAFFLFAQDTFFLSQGVSQYADTTVAFFFLCAHLCAEHVNEDRKYIALSALCLGCCAWTKNEGLILSFVYILFNLKIFFDRKKVKYFILGISMPLIAIIIFKGF